jgi:anti-sigma regulatory factor (Ser/Thr protein kinase)
MATTAARPRETGYPGYSQTFYREPETAEKARRLARLAVTGWELGDDAAEIAALVLSELVANAVRHTRSRLLLVLVERPTPDRVRVAVVDRDAYRLPALRAADVDSINGRGLALVDALADRWDYDLLGPETRPTRKRVWAELLVKAEETTR